VLHNKRKRIVSLVLVVLLLFSLSNVAFASSANKNSSVIITSSLNDVVITVDETHTFALQAKYSPASQVSWFSNNDDLVKVNRVETNKPNNTSTATFDIIPQSSHANEVHTIIITARVSDTNFDTKSFTVTVNGPVADNNAPSVSIIDYDNDKFVLDEDTTLSFSIKATDSDGDAISASVITPPKHGTVQLIGKEGDNFKFIYTPNPNYYGSDSAEIEFSDGRGGKAKALVNFDITNVDDPPVAVDDTITIVVNSFLEAYNILANDTDIDGGAMYVILDGFIPPDGVTLTENGLLSYIPKENFIGEVKFDYMLNGGSTATVTLVVEADKPKVLNYVALGDSIATGTYYTSTTNKRLNLSYVYYFTEFLKTKFNQVNISNYSVDGHKTSDLLQRLNNTQVIESVKTADLITITIGANNLLEAAKKKIFGITYGYDFTRINWTVAEAGRAAFEKEWPLIVNRIKFLNPNAEILALTPYNPYNSSDSLYTRVNGYLSNTSGNGINDIIINNKEMGYKVVDVYTGLKSYSESNAMKEITYFYDSFRDPHPNVTGHKLIGQLHVSVFENPVEIK
jgi:lysophospholipase L1-like esterase